MTSGGCQVFWIPEPTGLWVYPAHLVGIIHVTWAEKRRKGPVWSPLGFDLVLRALLLV